MKCPFCGEEMEAGHVISGVNIMWTPHDVSKAPLRFWKKEGEFLLSTNPFGGSTLDGHICTACKKVVLNYKPVNLNGKGKN